MITPQDILKAVNRVLKENFPDIPRESHDVEEGFTKECFFVQTSVFISSHQNEIMTDENMTIRIHYFPKDTHINEAELYKMMAKLCKSIGLALKVTDDFVIPVNNIESSITGNHVLITEITLEYMQLLPEDEELEYITELEYRR